MEQPKAYTDPIKQEAFESACTHIRLHLSRDTWMLFWRPEGLPEEDAQAIWDRAFEKIQKS